MTSQVGRDLTDALAAVVERLRRVTVQVRAQNATAGAGVLWPGERPQGRGLVITNAHVVSDARAAIVLSDARSARARVMAHDSRCDLAALEVETTGDGEFAALRDSPSLRAGELALAIGHPGGLVGVATLGIIHRAERAHEGRRQQWVRADVRLAPGFSGGPLADAEGRIIGINTMMQGGLALAIPVFAVEAWLRQADALAVA